MVTLKPALAYLWNGSRCVPCDTYAVKGVGLLAPTDTLSIVMDSTPPETPGYTEMQAGAVIPIATALPGVNEIYVATDGDDLSGTGTSGSPYATLSKALLEVPSGGTIVVRGGTYSMTANRLNITKPVTIRAYPNEVPEFDGAIPAGSMTAENDLRFFSYTSLRTKRKGTDGVSLTSEDFYPAAISGGQVTALAQDRGWVNVWSDNTFSVPTDQTAAGENTGNPGGKTFHKARVVTGIYPDQCWANGIPLIQVQVKEKVKRGYFYVDRTTGLQDVQDGFELAESTVMYIHQDDAAKTIEVSTETDSTDPYMFLINADNVTLQGLRIKRHSAFKSFMTVQTQTGISNFTMEDVEILDSANVAIKLYGDAETTGSNPGLPTFSGNSIVKNTTLRRVTVKGTGWLGMSAQYTDDTLMTDCRFENFNRHFETDQSPKNGAMKCSKNHRFTIEHSVIKDCHDGHGIWFDQSNYDCVFASNEVKNVDGSPLFWEISHNVLIVNNIFIKGNNSGINVRISGGSGVRLINNTIVGGAYPLYIIAELRGQQMGNGQWFAEQDFRYANVGFQTTPLSGKGLSSDIDRARPGARFASYANSSGVGNLTPDMYFKGGANEILNNVIVHTGSDNPALYLRGRTANSQVNVPANEVVPPILDGNVYQSLNGQVARVDTASTGTPGHIPLQTTIAGWRSELADVYYSYITGKEAASLAGPGYADLSHGAPLPQLAALQGQAAVAPSDAAVTAYVPGGNRRFGSYLYGG